MPRLFDITTTSDNVTIDAGGSGKVVFTVTNTSPKPVRGSFRPKVLDSGQSGWLALNGEVERDFPPAFTHQVELTIKVPADTPPGKFRARLDALSVANPDDDFTEGPMVSVGIVKREGDGKPKPSLWWLWVLIGVIVLVIVGVVVFLAMRKDTSAETTVEKPVDKPVDTVKVPAGLVGQPFADAKQRVEAVGLVVNRRDTNIGDGCAGNVLSSEPAPGATAASGVKVTLNVGVLPYGPDTCKQGFVWREAFAGDTVCVTGDSRERARRDNAEAASRQELVSATSKDFDEIQRTTPKASAVPKGDFSQLSRFDNRVIMDQRYAMQPMIARCKAGFVERRARAQDRVCVSEATQLATADENDKAQSRKACATK